MLYLYHYLQPSIYTISRSIFLSAVVNQVYVMKHFNFISQDGSSKTKKQQSGTSENPSSSQDLAAQGNVSGKAFFELLTQAVRNEFNLDANAEDTEDNHNENDYNNKKINKNNVDTQPQTIKKSPDNTPLNLATPKLSETKNSTTSNATIVDSGFTNLSEAKVKTQLSTQKNDTDLISKPEAKNDSSTTTNLSRDNKLRTQFIFDTLRDKLGCCKNTTLLAGK